jgi:hypothetical protein
MDRRKLFLSMFRDISSRKAVVGFFRRRLGLSSHAEVERLPHDLEIGFSYQGIEYIVERSKSGGTRRTRSSAHRLKYECPFCAQVLSCGRFWQHRCKKFSPGPMYRETGAHEHLLSYKDIALDVIKEMPARLPFLLEVVSSSRVHSLRGASMYYYLGGHSIETLDAVISVVEGVSMPDDFIESLYRLAGDHA